MSISIGNHMNLSAIWEIIALSHAFEENLPSQKILAKLALVVKRQTC